MNALGVPMDQRVAAILGDLRPYLRQSLQRLSECGLLRSQDSKRNRHTVRRTLEGAWRNVLHIETNLLLGESAQSAHVRTVRRMGRFRGPIIISRRRNRPTESAHGSDLRFLRTQWLGRLCRFLSLPTGWNSGYERPRYCAGGPRAGWHPPGGARSGGGPQPRAAAR